MRLGIQKMDPPADADEADLPVWIKESLSEDYGEDKLRQLLETMDTVRPLCLRLNLTRGSRQEMPEKLKRQLEEQTGRPALLMEGAICPEAVYVHHPGDISRLEMFQKGEISVQDESSMAAVLALDPQKGEKVLDLCGAPGGKSCFCAERMENEGYISCRDIHPHRVDLIRQNAERLGLTILHPGEGDALKPCPEDAEAFDRVLLDAPCSGLGILRSKRDMAEHRSSSDVEELSALQETMLETAAAALKPGGRLVYSTCTLTKKENDLQVEAFLAKHPEFELLDIGNLFRKCDPEEVTLRQTATLWPVNEGHDGFFVAAMEKKPRQI